MSDDPIRAAIQRLPEANAPGGIAKSVMERIRLEDTAAADSPPTTKRTPRDRLGAVAGLGLGIALFVALVLGRLVATPVGVRSITSWAELNQVGTVVTMAAVALYAISLHSIGSGLPRGRNVER